MNAAARASRFINVLAWSFIVLAGASLAMSAMQNIVLNLLLTPELLQQALGGLDADSGLDLPPALLWLLRHARGWMLLGLLMAAFTLIAAIALLKRRNWARIVFIVLLALGIGLNLLGALLPFGVQQWMLSNFGPGIEDFEAQLRPIFMAVGAIVAVLMLAFSALHVWLIWRLCSPEVRREFKRGGERAA